MNSQLIITTHSAHIFNSKIHSGNTFNSINYITIKNGYSKVVVLDDDKIVRCTCVNNNRFGYNIEQILKRKNINKFINSQSGKLQIKQR